MLRAIHRRRLIVEATTVPLAIVVAALGAYLFAYPLRSISMWWSGVVAYLVLASLFLRFVASGYASPHPAGVLDVVAGSLSSLQWKSHGFTVRCHQTPYSNLERTLPLQGCTVLVTGGTVGGLGYWSCVLLARLGAAVAVSCRTSTMAVSTAHTITKVARVNHPRASELVPAAGVRLEITDAGSVSLLEEALRAAGVSKLHCVVHNAGVLHFAYSPEEIKRQANTCETMMLCNFVGTQAIVDRTTPLLAATAASEGCRTCHVVVSSYAAQSAPLTVQSQSNEEAVQRTRAIYDSVSSTSGAATEGGSTTRTTTARPATFLCYGLSKLGNLFTVRVAREEQRRTGSRVDAFGLHPGSALTNMTRNAHRYVRAVIPIYSAFFALLMKSPIEASYTTVEIVLRAFTQRHRGDAELEPDDMYWHDRAPAVSPHAATGVVDAAAAAVAIARREARLAGLLPGTA